MKIFLICIITAASISFSGCANKKIQPPIPFTKIEDFGDTIPKAGETNYVEIGMPIYQDVVARMDQKKELTLLQDAQSTSDSIEQFFIPKGSKGIAMAVLDYRYPSFCQINNSTNEVGSICLIDRDNDGTFERALNINTRRWLKIESQVPFTTKALKYEWLETLPAKASTDIKFIGKKRVLVYQGVSKGTIKVAYREYINDLARPAFSQDVAYDLEPDGTGMIAFQGARIKVLTTTATHLRYVLESPITGSPASLYPIPKN